jgi:ABC-type polysaccharide/polyol phosphate export permease
MDYLRRVIRLRHFWLALVRSDLRVRYLHSHLGIAWSLARPVGMTIVLTTVFAGAFDVPVANYVPFLFLGIALWHFLVQSMMLGCGTFRTAAPYLRQQAIPLAVFPLRTVLGAGIHFTLVFVIALFLTAYFVGLPSLPVLASVVPGLAVLFLVALALATLTGLLHTHYPDTQPALEIALQGLFYLTPVMYRPDLFTVAAPLSDLLAWNPVTAVIELVRTPLLTGELASPAHVLQALAFLGIIGGLAWVGLRRCERELVFWI